MDIIIDTFLVGLGAVGTFFASKVLKLKSKPKEYELGVYDFQNHMNRTCPKCSMQWERKAGYDYCECEEYHSGHFHVQCKGHVDGKGAGCGFKYIMRTK